PCCGRPDGRLLPISIPATMPPSGSPAPPGSCPPPSSMTARPAGPARHLRCHNPRNSVPHRMSLNAAVRVALDRHDAGTSPVLMPHGAPPLAARLIVVHVTETEEDAAA